METLLVAAKHGTILDHTEFSKEFFHNDEKIGSKSMMDLQVVLKALNVDKMPGVEYYEHGSIKGLYGCKMLDVAKFMRKNNLTFDLSAGEYVGKMNR